VRTGLAVVFETLLHAARGTLRQGRGLVLRPTPSSRPSLVVKLKQRRVCPLSRGVMQLRGLCARSKGMGVLRVIVQSAFLDSDEDLPAEDDEDDADANDEMADGPAPADGHAAAPAGAAQAPPATAAAAATGLRLRITTTRADDTTAMAVDTPLIPQSQPQLPVPTPGPAEAPAAEAAPAQPPRLPAIRVRLRGLRWHACTWALTGTRR
jgi:hypothetical protein